MGQDALSLYNATQNEGLRAIPMGLLPSSNSQESIKTAERGSQ